MKNLRSASICASQQSKSLTTQKMCRQPADGEMRLTVRWPQDAASNAAFICGDRIRAVVRLLPPEIYRDPGVWSRADYLLDQGITSTATVNVDRVERDWHRAGPAPGVPHRRTCSMQQRTNCWRCPRRCGAFLRRCALSEDDAVMLAAMVAGDRTYLTHSLRVGFERTGSFHMLVVSGFHLAIVAGCIFWIARRLRLPRVPATLLTIAASFAYALFHRIRHAGAALAVDGDALSAGPAGLPRAQPAEHHRLCARCACWWRARAACSTRACR